MTISLAKLDTACSTPTSVEFGDIYFSPTDGIGESRFHFIEGNDLPARFREHFARKANFTVGETGFGTGLNVLLTAALWQQQSAQPIDTAPTLHFISVEKHPITKAQLVQIYQQQGWQSDTAQSLLAQYPHHPKFGTVTFSLSEHPAPPIQLTLLFGDAATCLQAHDFYTDAWYLDGFAPAKNPAMWSPELFVALAKNSRAGTTFATFTAASKVRRGLEAVGFAVTKGKGFGRKRERLLGQFL